MQHQTASREDWLAARRLLMVKEKARTRLGDAIAAERRALPWVRIVKEYLFDSLAGKVTLAELFDGRSQLLVYHFMFPPEDDVGCKSCSFWADNFNPNVIHLNARDVSFAAVSRAPFEKLEAYRERMGWDFHWVSSGGTDFNFNYGVSFAANQQEEDVYNYGSLAPRIADREGLSVFVREGEQLFHTYSAYARGIDLVNTAYNYLDLVPKGRDEGDRGQYWVRRHDEY